jgi:regulator of RNase E activity RraA
VISCSPNAQSAVWGELLSLEALSRGLAGPIVDGAVRDASDISSLGYPVFALRRNARKARKERRGECNVPIRCGSSIVRPGDLVVADLNGILFICPSEIEQTLVKVREVAKKESEIKEQRRLGVSIADILGIRSRL